MRRELKILIVYSTKYMYTMTVILINKAYLVGFYLGLVMFMTSFLL